MRQCEFAPGIAWSDVNAHAGRLTRVFWNGESEDQPVRPVDFEILAAMLDVLPVAPIDKDELASDTCVDLDTHHLPGRRGEQPSARGLGIEPSIENPLG
jgi:hypothetical protein